MIQTRESAGGLASMAVRRRSIDDEVQAMMIFTPFNIEWVIQFLTSGNFTLSGVRDWQGPEPIRSECTAIV
jgi:hypothetical protein